MRRIVAASWGAVDFAPATVSEEVVQNVRTILSTAAGTHKTGRRRLPPASRE